MKKSGIALRVVVKSLWRIPSKVLFMPNLVLRKGSISIILSGSFSPRHHLRERCNCSVAQEQDKGV